ncbi:replication-association protein [Mastrevirus sp.]|nr:replication-association protein [Mastrevirus sp.]
MMLCTMSSTTFLSSIVLVGRLSLEASQTSPSTPNMERRNVSRAASQVSSWLTKMKTGFQLCPQASGRTSKQMLSSITCMSLKNSSFTTKKEPTRELVRCFHISDVFFVVMPLARP